MPTLSQYLQNKLIPWAANSAGKRLIVAKQVMKKGQLPDGVRLDRRKIPGKRIRVKDQRFYANTRSRSAHWPQARLNEVENLKLVCVLSGRTAYQINEYLLHTGEGYFIFLPPGTPHPDGTTGHQENDTDHCELLNVLLHRGAVQCWICYSKKDEHYSDSLENYLLRDDRLVHLFQLLVEEAIEEKEHSQFACQNLLTAFFTVLHRELLAGRYLHPGPKTIQETSSSDTGDFVTTIREYIQAHLHEPLTLENTARQMHLSRSQFARQIKQETGTTFVEILTQCRIEEAKLLLLESEWTSSVIAEFVGFKSVTYFHNLFVRRTGTTPGHFRKAEKNQIP